VFDILNVQLLIRSTTDILNVTVFKYSLHNFRENILHWKYQSSYALRVQFIVQNFVKIDNRGWLWTSV